MILTVDGWKLWNYRVQLGLASAPQPLAAEAPRETDGLVSADTPDPIHVPLRQQIRDLGLEVLQDITHHHLSTREQVELHANLPPEPEQEQFMASTATINPAPSTASKAKTFLQHAGAVLRKILHIGEEAAVVAEPIVAAAFPDVSKLFISSIGLAQAAEATAASTTGTGAQKLAQVVTGLNPMIDTFVKDNNLGDWESSNRAKFASAIADALNLIPSPKAA